MDPVAIALQGILPPLLIGTLVLSVAWRPFAREKLELGRRTAWGAPLAIGLGYLATHVATSGWPPLAVSVELKHGLFYLALAALALGLAEARLGRPLVGTRALYALAVPWYLLDFVRAHQWGPVEGWIWTLGLGAGVFGLLAAGEHVARRERGFPLPVAWTLLGTATALALHFAGTSSLAQLTGGWTAVLGVAGVLGLLVPGLGLANGPVVPLVLLFAGALMGGFYAAALEAAAAGLLLLAALGPWATGAVPGRLSDRVRGLSGIALTAALGALAVWVQIHARGEDPYAGY